MTNFCGLEAMFILGKLSVVKQVIASDVIFI